MEAGLILVFALKKVVTTAAVKNQAMKVRFKMKKLEKACFKAIQMAKWRLHF